MAGVAAGLLIAGGVTTAVLLTRDEGPLRFRPPSLDEATCEQILAAELDVFQQVLDLASSYSSSEQEALLLATDMEDFPSDVQQFFTELQVWELEAAGAETAVGCSNDAWCRAMEPGVQRLHGSDLIRNALVMVVQTRCTP